MIKKPTKLSLAVLCFFCAILPACNPKAKINVRMERCSNENIQARLMVFVRSGSAIDHIIFHSDTLSRTVNPSLDLDFDLEIGPQDSLKLMLDEQVVMLKNFNMNFPSVEISTDEWGDVELHYLCAHPLFD